MKSLKIIALALLTGASFALSMPGRAQGSNHGSPGKIGANDAPISPADMTDMTDMTDGEIRKVDKGNKKLTIKHGEIKNLDMPGMTMVFQVMDATMIDSVKVGDKVRFVAEKGATGFVVSEIQVSH